MPTLNNNDTETGNGEIVIRTAPAEMRQAYEITARNGLPISCPAAHHAGVTIDGGTWVAVESLNEPAAPIKGRLKALCSIGACVAKVVHLS